MSILFYTIFFTASALLIAVILLQEGKGGGLGGAFGGAGGEAFGHGAGGISRFTIYMAVAFLGSAIAIQII